MQACNTKLQPNHNLQKVYFSYAYKMFLSLFHALQEVVGGEDAEFACLGEVGEGGVFVAGLEMGESSVEIGFAKVGIGLYSFRKTGRCRSEVLKEIVDTSFVKPCIHQSRIQSQCCIIVGYGV